MVEHFSEKLAKDLPNQQPFFCPLEGCGRGKEFRDYQSLKRHYMGNVHGILISYVDEFLADKKGVKAELVNNEVKIVSIWN